MKFKKDKVVYSDDLYYDLFDGGYILPEELLEDDEDIRKIDEAISLIRDFLSEAESEGVLELG